MTASPWIWRSPPPMAGFDRTKSSYDAVRGSQALVGGPAAVKSTAPLSPAASLILIHSGRSSVLR